MKKKILTLCLMFVFMFIININTVKGVTTVCEYGIKESDDADWESKIVLLVTGDDNIVVDTASSEVFKAIETSDGTPNVAPDKLEPKAAKFRYHVTADHDLDKPNNYYIYVNLYPIAGDFKKEGYKCPDAVMYKFTQPKKGDDVFSMSIYVDDIAKGQIVYDMSDGAKESSTAASHFGFVDTTGYMVSKEAKNKKLNEVFDIYGCYTYSSYYQAMSQAKYANGGSCDANSEFSKNYKELKDLCTAYRSSELYTDSNGEVSSGCQTACTNLDDDVAELCGFTNDGYCGSLSSEVVTYIFKLFGIARYIVPALLIILSIIDYIKAIASESEDEMKKVSGRFVKRMLAAALVILVPLVIDFILGLFDIPGLSADKPFCN